MLPLSQRNALTLQLEAVVGHISGGDDETTFSFFGGSLGYRRFSESTRYFLFAELGAGYSPELLISNSDGEVLHILPMIDLGGGFRSSDKFEVTLGIGYPRIGVNLTLATYFGN